MLQFSNDDMYCEGILGLLHENGLSTKFCRKIEILKGI